MFLRAAKTEAEEAGESTDGMASSVSELRNEILNLTGQKVDIQIDENKFKSTYQILKELSKVWGELTDISKANILEMIGGKRNSNVVAALLENFSIAEKALKVSANSAGSAMAENEKYLDSIAGRVEKLKASFQTMSGNMISSDTIKNAVSLATAFVDALNALQKIHVLLPAIAASVALISGNRRMRSVERSKNAAGAMAGLLANSMKENGKVSEKLIMLYVDLAEKEKEYVSQTLLAAVSAKKLSKNQYDEIVAALGVATAHKAVDASNKSMAASFKAVTASIPVWGQVLFVVTAVIEAISFLTGLSNKHRQEMIDNANKSIDDFKGANDTYNSNIKSLEGLRQEFESLSKGVDANGKNISLTGDEYARYLELVNQIGSMSPEIVSGYDKEGNAILNYKSAIDDAIESQNKYIENQKAMYLASGETIFEGKEIEYKEAIDKLEDAGKKLGKAFRENIEREDYISVFKNSGVDYKGYWEYDQESVLEMYEKSEQIMSRLRAMGKYTEADLAAVSQAFFGIASAYSQMDAVEFPEIDYIMTYLKDSSGKSDGWFDNIPAGALDELRDGIAGVNNPLLSYSENIAAASVFAENFATAIQTDGVKSIMDLSSGLSDGSVTIEEYNAEVSKLEESWQGNADILPFIIMFLNSLSAGFSDVSDSADETVTSLEEITKSLESLKKEREAVKKAVSDQSGNGALTSESYEALISASKDYISCIENEGGYLRLNAEAAGELLETKTQLQVAQIELAKADEAKRYREIEAAIRDADQTDKEFIDTKKAELEATGELITKYSVLQSELMFTISAYGKWKDAQNAPETGDMYEDTKKALQQIQEGLESDRIGSVKFKASVNMLIPEPNRSDVSAYVEKLEKYITEDASGIDQFIADSIDSGLMNLNDDGTASIISDATVQDFCEKLTITPSMAQAIFGELEMYDWDIHWEPSDFIDAMNSMQAPIKANIEEIAVYQTKLDEARQQLRELYEQPVVTQEEEATIKETIQIYEQAIRDSGGVVKPDTTEAEGDLSKISASIDEIAEKVDTVSAKMIGDLGASITEVALQSVVAKLHHIDSIELHDKSFTVYQNTVHGAQPNNPARKPASNYVSGGGSSANGTDFADGGKTLVGELGPELVVSDDRYYMVGTRGAEIVNLKRGDMVFNHIDTQKILEGKSGVRGQALWAGALGDRFVLVNDFGYSGSKKPVITQPNSKISGSGSSTVGGNGSSSGGGGGSGSWSGSSGSSGSSGGSNSSKDKEESWFEKQLREQKHLLEMDKKSKQEYLDWLNDAYKKAYNENILDLKEFYSYEEEVYKGRQDLVKDFLGDLDHQISMIEGVEGSSDDILKLIKDAIARIEKELSAAYASGLDSNNEYVQYLQQQWNNYHESAQKIQDDADKKAKDSIDKLVDYRIRMLKQEIQDQKDALSKKLSDLKDFYSRQKEMLQDQRDEEKYLDEQKEKRKSVADLKADLAMLEFDNSAWAKKRKLELQAELAKAEKELSEFEKDHAFDNTMDMLDKQLESQESQIQAEMDALDAKLNDPHALFNQALSDIKNNTAELYKQFIAYNRKNGSGDDSDVNALWEEAYKADLEYQSVNGGKHKDDIAIGNYTGYKPSTPPSLPAAPPPKPQSQDSKPQSSPVPQSPPLNRGSTIQVKPSATHFASGSGNLPMAGFVPGGTYSVYEVNGNEVLIGRNGAYTGWIRKSDIVGYASGTANAASGLHRIDEVGPEYIFESKRDGSKFRMFGGGEKVLNAKATSFLYDFATSGGSVMSKMLQQIMRIIPDIGGASRQSVIEINAGDIIVQGNATNRTVSELRRAQRDNLEFVIREFNKLNK